MKKQELQTVIDVLDTIKKFSNQQDYNTSNFLNTNLMKILPLLNKELERMTSDKIDINCPKLEIVTSFVNDKDDLANNLNNRIKELVMAEYKIIDFGIFREDTTKFSGYIKYTS